MNRKAYSLLSLSLLLAGLGSACLPPSGAQDINVDLAGLSLQSLSDAQQGLLRATAQIHGLSGGNEVALEILSGDDGKLYAKGSFDLDSGTQGDQVLTLRLYGRIDADGDEALLARQAQTITVHSGEANAPELSGTWQSDGEALFDLNRNGQSNLEDLLADIDPTPPGLFFDTAPQTLEFFSGIRLGDFERRIVLVQNKSGDPITVNAQLFDAPGVLLVPVDAGGASEASSGAKRGLQMEIPAYGERFLGVSFAPMNAYLTTGSLLVKVINSRTKVRQSAQVKLLANTGGNPQAVPSDFSIADIASDSSLAGIDAAKVATFPAASLFSGLVLSPSDSNTHFSQTLTRSGAFVRDSQGVEMMPADRALLVQIPAGYRFSATLSGLSSDVDLGLFPLDSADNVIADAESVLLSQTLGTGPEAIALRNTAEHAMRALLVLGRHENAALMVTTNALTDTADNVPFSLSAHVVNGPEFDEQDPLDPQIGAIEGGLRVTLRGRGFQHGASVRFADAQAVDTQINDMGTQVQCTLPPGSLDVGKNPATVVVVNPSPGEGGDGQAATLPEAFTYLPPAPRLSQAQPNRGLVEGGTPVTVYGSFFSDRFDGPELSVAGVVLAPSAVSYISPSELAIVMPPHSAGSVDIKVYNYVAPGERSSSPDSLSFSYIASSAPAPILTSVSPSEGSVDGNSLVTLDGQNFAPGSLVRFANSAAASVEYMSPEQLRARSPSHVAGLVDVSVINPDGQSSRLDDSFNYFIPPPSVLAVFPDVVVQSGGDRLAVDGTGFRDGSQVQFVNAGQNFSAASVTRVSSSRLLVVTPAMATAGEYILRVLNSDGQSSDYSSVRFAEPEGPAPHIVTVSPAQIPVNTASSIEISGQNFAQNCVVSLAGLAATDLIVNAEGSNITLLSPSIAQPGQVELSVINPDGQSDDRLIDIVSSDAPSINAITPMQVHANIAGESVVLFGEHFSPVSELRIVGAGIFGGDLVLGASLLHQTSNSIQVNINQALSPGGPYAIVVDFSDGNTANLVAALSAMPAQISMLGPAGDDLSPFLDAELLVLGAWLNPDKLLAIDFVDADSVSTSASLLSANENLITAALPSGGLAPGQYQVNLSYNDGFHEPAGTLDISGLRLDGGQDLRLPAQYPLQGIPVQLCGHNLGRVFSANPSFTLMLDNGQEQIVPAQLNAQGDNCLELAFASNQKLAEGGYQLLLTDGQDLSLPFADGAEVYAALPWLKLIMPNPAEQGEQVMVLGDNLEWSQNNGGEWFVADDGNGNVTALNTYWLDAGSAQVDTQNLAVDQVYSICILRDAANCQGISAIQLSIVQPGGGFGPSQCPEPCHPDLEPVYDNMGNCMCAPQMLCDQDVDQALFCQNLNSSCVPLESVDSVLNQYACVQQWVPCSPEVSSALGCTAAQTCWHDSIGVPFCGDPCVSDSDCERDSSCLGVGSASLCFSYEADNVCPPGTHDVGWNSDVGSVGASYCLSDLDCSRTGVDQLISGGSLEQPLICQNGEAVNAPALFINATHRSDWPLKLGQAGFASAGLDLGSESDQVSLDSLGIWPVIAESNGSVFSLLNSPTLPKTGLFSTPLQIEVAASWYDTADLEALLVAESSGTAYARQAVLLQAEQEPVLPCGLVDHSSDVDSATTPVFVDGLATIHEEICPAGDYDYVRVDLDGRDVQVRLWPKNDQVAELAAYCDNTWPPATGAYTYGPINPTDSSTPAVLNLSSSEYQKCALEIYGQTGGYDLQILSAPSIERIEPPVLYADGPGVEQTLDIYGKGFVGENGLRIGDGVDINATTNVNVHGVRVIDSTHLQVTVEVDCANGDGDGQIFVQRAFGGSASSCPAEMPDCNTIAIRPPRLVIGEIVLDPYYDYSEMAPPGGWNIAGSPGLAGADDAYVSIYNPGTCNIDLGANSVLLHLVEPTGVVSNSPQDLAYGSFWINYFAENCDANHFAPGCALTVTGFSTTQVLSPLSNISLYRQQSTDYELIDSVQLGSNGVPDGSQFMGLDAVHRDPETADQPGFDTPSYHRKAGEPLFAPPAPKIPGVWTVQQVYNGSTQQGTFSDIAIDNSNQQPVIAFSYLNVTEYPLSLWHLSDGTWAEELVQANTMYAGGVELLDDDSNGNFALAYELEGDLDFSRYSTQWTLDWGASGVSYSLSALSDAASPGAMHVAFVESGGNLRYGFWDGVNLSPTTLLANNVGVGISLVREEGALVLYFRNASTTQLYQRRFNGSGWDAPVTLTFSPSSVDYFSAQSDGMTTQIAAYIFNNALGHLYYSADGGQNFSLIDDSSDNVGKYCDLALDESGHAHIAYRDVDNKTLKYATNADGDWHIETVDSVGDVGISPSIVVDSNGIPHISYYSQTRGAIMYATP